MSHHKTRFAILSSALLLGVFITGCHVWHGPEEGSGGWWYYCDASGCYRCTVGGCEFPYDGCDTERGCTTPTDGPTDGACRVSAECGGGFVCTRGRCVPGRVGPCSDNPDCGDGACCRNGTCQDTGLCQKDAECAAHGEGFICDDRGSCVPGPVAQPVTCTDAAGCDEGLCVDGQCGSCSGDCGGGAEPTCQLDRHCGEGRACLDGRCAARCSGTGDCGSSQTCDTDKGVCVAAPAAGCQGSDQCGAGQLCINQRCHDGCTDTGACARTADRCSPAIELAGQSVRACMPDPSAHPECKVSADCQNSETCVNGVCRTVCDKAVDCAGCDDGPVCAQGGYCMTQAETTPQCKISADCKAGQLCLDAQCI